MLCSTAICITGGGMNCAWVVDISPHHYCSVHFEIMHSVLSISQLIVSCVNDNRHHPRIWRIHVRLVERNSTRGNTIFVGL